MPSESVPRATSGSDPGICILQRPASWASSGFLRILGRRQAGRDAQILHFWQAPWRRSRRRDNTVKTTRFLRLGSGLPRHAGHTPPEAQLCQMVGGGGRGVFSHETSDGFWGRRQRGRVWEALNWSNLFI